VQGGIWIDREWEMLRLLSDAGAPVPRPIERTGEALLMTYIGDLDAASPQLHSYRPDDREEAEDLFDQTIEAVEHFLYRNVIHADLSAYNLLVWEGRLTVIDFPQAVDPRKNKHAEALLERDIQRMCDHFERWGVQRHAGRIAQDLWTAWTFADLVPEELRGLTM
jgi:RIO kinase 1